MSLSHESRALQSRLDTEQDAIQRMEAVLNLVERFPSGETAPGEGPTLQVHTHAQTNVLLVIIIFVCVIYFQCFASLAQECARIFETLQTDYYEEYKTMGLADLAVAVVHPLLKEKLHSWDPLKVVFILNTGNYTFVDSIINPETFLLHFFRTALFVWRTLVSGELYLSLEIFFPVLQIQIWTLTTGTFKTFKCV